MSEFSGASTMTIGDPDPPAKLPRVYWLTRGRWHGKLKDRVEIWACEPERLRMRVDGDVIWSPPLDLVDSEPTYLGSWSIAQARLHVGNGAPAEDNECVRVGLRYEC